jgi:tetratricopeptide (TPR) repeat protein
MVKLQKFVNNCIKKIHYLFYFNNTKRLTMKNIRTKNIDVKLTMIIVMTSLTSLFGFSVYANTPPQNDFSQALRGLQHQWVAANYAEDEAIKNDAFIALQDKSAAITNAFPEQAAAWIWQGIIQSSYAGVKGGLGALSLVDEAKNSLEKALVINENALQGAAHTSLGILYLKVPGWPVSFGDEEQSEKHLKTALAINPTGIDVNYFLAEFYVEQEEYQKAREHLIAARSAPARQGREDADEFRQLEVNSLLTQVNKALDEH